MYNSGLPSQAWSPRKQKSHEEFAALDWPFLILGSVMPWQGPNLQSHEQEAQPSF